MLGQVVLLRLQEQYTLAAISAVQSEDVVDLRAFVLYADGHIGVAEIPGARRGDGVDQWREPPAWPVPVTPQLQTVRAELMPVALLPVSPPPMPLMVIIRY